MQVIDPLPAGGVELLDYSGGGPDEAWRRLMSLSDRELERPFDLAGGPLLRARLVRLAAEDHVLLITVHHVVFDGYSAGILVQDLAALYAAQVTGEPSGLAELPVLTGAELHRELAEWNDTAVTFPGGCLHQGFEAQASLTPDAVAVELGADHIPYGRINSQANQIARRLRETGIGPEALVGVCLPPSPRRVAALLGILKAGGGYVPLDPALPPERIAFMMADAGLAVVLADDSTQARLPATQMAARVLPRNSWPTRRTASAGTSRTCPTRTPPARQGSSAGSPIG
ncbi:MAG TPA: AMP-binding protein [Streptosporangiaceae bacterium]